MLHPADPAHRHVPVKSKDGNDQWTPIAGTLRVYTNDDREEQREMLWTAHDKRLDKTERMRLAVVGCKEGHGEVRKITRVGLTLGRMDWAAAGNAVIDGIAVYMCLGAELALPADEPQL